MLRRERPLAFLLTLILMACAGNRAYAHKINLFASVEGGIIKGEVYSSGGGRPANCRVRFMDIAGNVLGERTTNARGGFSYTPTQQTDHVVIVNTGDGHRAEYTVKAGEFLPTPIAPPEVAAPSNLPNTPSSESPQHSDAEEIEEAVERAVARQLQPLREQLARAEERVRLKDILGGIGYILGLMGVAIYFNHRKNSKGAA